MLKYFRKSKIKQIIKGFCCLEARHDIDLYGAPHTSGSSEWPCVWQREQQAVSVCCHTVQLSALPCSIREKALGAPGPENCVGKCQDLGQGNGESEFMESLPLSPRLLKLQAQWVRWPALREGGLAHPRSSGAGPAGAWVSEKVPTLQKA